MSKQTSLLQIKPQVADQDGPARLLNPLLDIQVSGAPQAAELFREFLESLALSDDVYLQGELQKNVKLKDFLTAVFSASPYLHELAQKFPAVVKQCHLDGFEVALEAALTSMEFDGSDLLNEALVMQRLRVAKRKAALICGLADLGGWWESSRVSQGISDTADKALESAVRHLLLKVHNAGKLALPNKESPQTSSGYVVIAMGKHGARELNYSSDIDLIVFFDPDAPVVLDPEESVVLFGRITRSLVKIMQDSTVDGYVFRTDLRLRPDPGSMPVAIPVGLALHYYESRGQNWERAALIKARAVAGDLDFGKRVLDELKPFIWRRYLDYAAIADVHSIKRQIQSHKGYTALDVPGHNVKLGRGGIREIEFFVQTQQLIAGGRASELRGRETLNMLSKLVAQKWVEPDVCKQLTQSYKYLRDIEHRLQMVNDEQTHIIPDNAEQLENIARLCGFSDVRQFEMNTRGHLERVEKHYSNLFSREPELTGRIGNLSFTGDDDDPGTVDTLEQLGFERPSAAIAILRGWHFGRYKAMQSTDARERLTDITPSLIECFSNTGNPSEALFAFDEFLRGLPAGFQLFNLLRANESLLKLLVMVLGVAPRLASIVTRRPHVFDGLLEPDFFNTELNFETLKDRLARSLTLARDYEDGLDRARQFVAEQRFLIGIRVLSGNLSTKAAGKSFSLLAKCMMDGMLSYVVEEFQNQHGRVENAEYAIIAMGNFGTHELTAGSDLDLVATYEFDNTKDTSNGKRPLHASQYFGRLTQRLIAAMSAPTADGIIYELDFRLRPSGNSGPLATSLQYFNRYHSDEAWAWERLALTRARVISGSETFAAKVSETIAKLSKSNARSHVNRTEILKMRMLMDAERRAKSVWDVKLTKGGLVDLEFMAQWAVLSGDVGTLDTTYDVLEEMDLPDENARNVLLDAFNFYVKIIQIGRICLSVTYDPSEAPKGLNERLLQELNCPDIAHAEAQLISLQKQTRAAFLHYFEQV